MGLDSKLSHDVMSTIVLAIYCRDRYDLEAVANMLTTRFPLKRCLLGGTHVFFLFGECVPQVDNSTGGILKSRV